MVKVHYLGHSRAQRILWLLEELGLSYEVIKYERHDLTLRAPTTLSLVHPLGKSPVIVDGNLVLAESGAILEYLQQTYDQENRFRPTDPQKNQQCTYWLHYAEGSLMPVLFIKLIFARLGGGRHLGY